MAMTSTLARRFSDDPVFRNFRNLSVGFDHLFENVLASREPQGYPPYNIVQTSPGHYQIEVALAGFKKTDIVITSKESSLFVERCLTGPGPNVERDDNRFESSDDGTTAGVSQVEYVHRGISKRNFSLQFRLAEQVQVQSAKMEDGILTIKLIQLKSDESGHQVAIE